MLFIQYRELKSSWKPILKIWVKEIKSFWEKLCRSLIKKVKTGEKMVVLIWRWNIESNNTFSSLKVISINFTTKWVKRTSINRKSWRNKSSKLRLSSMTLNLNSIQLISYSTWSSNYSKTTKSTSISFLN